jgi:hypothetical protein
VRYVPDAKAVHIWGGSSKIVKVETLVRLYRSRVQFFRKHYGPLATALYKGILYFNSLSRTISGSLFEWVSKNGDLHDKSEGYRQVLRSLRAF